MTYDLLNLLQAKFPDDCAEFFAAEKRKKAEAAAQKKAAR